MTAATETLPHAVVKWDVHCVLTEDVPLGTVAVAEEWGRRAMLDVEQIRVHYYVDGARVISVSGRRILGDGERRGKQVVSRSWGYYGTRAVDLDRLPESVREIVERAARGRPACHSRRAARACRRDRLDDHTVGGVSAPAARASQPRQASSES